LWSLARHSRLRSDRHLLAAQADPATVAAMTRGAAATKRKTKTKIETKIGKKKVENAEVRR